MAATFLRLLAMALLPASATIGLPSDRGAVVGEDKPSEWSDADEYVALFDGATLDGWRKVGGEATFTVEDDCIVGRGGPGGNTFLRTERDDFSDFILRVELKLDEPVNSGIQFRSHAKPNGTVYGYQCEVDPSARGWSGGVYDESRRGWLVPLDGETFAEARKALRLDDWNEFVIRCRGRHIETWVNDVKCADLRDDADAEGFIALQIHTGGKGVIRWRSVRVRELEEERELTAEDAESAERSKGKNSASDGIAGSVG